jgi:hypothetical protein
MSPIVDTSSYIDIVVLWLDQGTHFNEVRSLSSSCPDTGTQAILFMDLRVKPEDDGRHCRDRNNTETYCLNLMTLLSSRGMDAEGF